MAVIREICPRCNRNAFVTTPKNGLSFCFLCRYWQRDGNAVVQPKVRSEHKEEIRALYKQATWYYHSSLTTEATQYLHDRGITDQTIQNQKLGYCPQGKSPLYKGIIAVEAGLGLPHDQSATLAHRITLPYLHDNDEVTDIRGRALDPDDEVRYKSLYNHAFFRWADYPFNYHLRNNERVVFTEGEIKAIVATQYGYPTLALPGMTTWRQGYISTYDRREVIVFDSQVKNVRAVRDAIIRAADNMNLLTLRIGTLPLFGHEKMDIDQLIIEYGIEVFNDVVRNALPYYDWLVLTERF